MIMRNHITRPLTTSQSEPPCGEGRKRRLATLLLVLSALSGDIEIDPEPFVVFGVEVDTKFSVGIDLGEALGLKRE